MPWHGARRQQPATAGRGCRYEKEYAPLLQDDIDSEPPPRRPVRDSYMQSRLERFYAELAQFQPGQTRGAYEERLATLGDGLLPPNVHRCAPQRPQPPAAAIPACPVITASILSMRCLDPFPGSLCDHSVVYQLWMSGARFV